MDSQQIYKALWDVLEGLPEFATKSRRLRHWTDTKAQPALYFVEGTQTAQTQTGLPTKWLFNAKVHVYAKTTAGQNPGEVMAPLLDTIRTALCSTHPVTGISTLPIQGIAYCRIDGRIDTDGGTLGDQAVAVIPIALLVV